MFPVKIGFRDNVTCVTLEGKVLRGHGVQSCKIHDGFAVHRMEEMRVERKKRNKQKESRARHTENNDKRKIRRNGRYTLFPNAACMT